MKNIFLAIALFAILPSSMQGNFTNSKDKVTIEITSDLLICNSKLESKTDKWSVMHVKALKIGKNTFDFVSRKSQRIEIIVTNY